jgi:hypothetical protein
LRSITANSVVDPRNVIAKNEATAASRYLIENVIGVLEFSSVSESYTIKQRFENIYFFIILVLFNISVIFTTFMDGKYTLEGGVYRWCISLTI